MGYSARYHAASLAAVFLALIVGILIGVGLGSDVVSGGTESLEQSLQEDVADARAETDELNTELDREREFSETAYPALVGGRLRGETIGLVALGDLPSEIADDVESALEPTDARVRTVAVVRVPPDVQAISEKLGARASVQPDEDPNDVEAIGRMVGRQLVRGGPLLQQAREEVLDRFSGRPAPIERLILVRAVPDDLAGADAELAGIYQDGLAEGLRSAAVEAVGVERSDTERSSIPFFESHEIPSSDSVDLTSGKVAMIFALLGAEGSFGTKDTADRLLPDLLPQFQTGARTAEGGAGGAPASSFGGP
jgi:hypothetical protein